MKKSLAALAVAGVAAASLVTMAPTASASGCVTTGLSTGWQWIGSTAYKANAGCLDLNLTYSDDANNNHDYYAGYYKNSSGSWTEGSRGYRVGDSAIYDGYHALGSIVLVSNLTPGREFGVGSFYDGGDYVEITH